MECRVLPMRCSRVRMNKCILSPGFHSPPCRRAPLGYLSRPLSSPSFVALHISAPIISGRSLQTCYGRKSHRRRVVPKMAGRFFQCLTEPVSEQSKGQVIEARRNNDIACTQSRCCTQVQCFVRSFPTRV